MPLTKITSGTIGAEDVAGVGVRRTSRSELQPDGKTWKAVEEWEGFARYRVGELDQEVAFPIDAATKASVRATLGALALVAIKAREGV